MRIWRERNTVVAWLIGTGFGVAVAWFGLRPILETTVPERAIPLSAAELRRLSPSVVSSPMSPPSPSPVRPSASATTSPTTVPTPTPSRTPGSTTSTVDGWTVVSGSEGSTTYLRSFSTDGGDTAIRMTPGNVSLVSATPRAGYTVDVARGDTTRLVVRFISGDRVFSVDAIWWENRPYVEITGP